MAKSKQSVGGRLRGYLNLHIDLPTIVIVLLIVAIFYRPLLSGVFAFAGFVETKTELPPWVSDLVIGIVVNIISAIIIVPLAFWIFRLRAKSELCGNFKAYDIVNGQERYWGKIHLTYNIFSNRVCGCLSSDHFDADIRIEGVFERGEYLRGHYVERRRSTRRRMGAFLLMLDGEGESYSGPYVFVDPAESNFLPREGRAKWVMEARR